VIKIKTTTETIESKSGLIPAGKIAMKTGLGSIQSSNVKSPGTIITSLFGLMVKGKSDFESIAEKRLSMFFKEALMLPFVFAKETVRLYLGKMTTDVEKIISQLHECSVKIIQEAPLHGIWIDRKTTFR